MRLGRNETRRGDRNELSRWAIAMSEPLINVVGVGLSGASSLAPEMLSIVRASTLLAGGRRHLSEFRDLVDERGIEALPLEDFSSAFNQMRSHLSAHPTPQVTVLASGDPLFFGVGRLLLTAFPAEQLAFHPHVSAMQLAFSRLKLPWQNATVLSAHGRSEALLTQALKRGDDLIAVLTDGVITPSAIATLIASLDIPICYRLWVCENLGGAREQIRAYSSSALATQTERFAALNVVVLQRQEADLSHPSALPLIGLPDSAFKGFCDRPTLMTKREIRLLLIGELAPRDGQVIWDIGAGTGSVSVELSRLCPTASLYAVEKTAAGVALIKENAARLAIAPIHAVQGRAPDVLPTLPAPSCVFIGGSSGSLIPILNYLLEHTAPRRVVLATATLESLTEVLVWVKEDKPSEAWHSQLMQVNISRSLPVGSLTRYSPLTPITLITLCAKSAT